MKSGSLNFFAAEADQRAVFDFLFTSTDVRVFDSYSEPDCELREFTSTEALHAVHPLGVAPYPHGGQTHLQIWSPSVSRKLDIQRFALNPAACNGATFRYRLSGGSLISLYLGGVCGQILGISHLGHFSRAGAGKWDLDDGIDWKAFARLSSRIRYHIGTRLAVGKSGLVKMLTHAAQLQTSGYTLR